MDLKTLQRYPVLRAELDQLGQMIQEIEAALYYPGAQQLTDMPKVQAPPGNNRQDTLAHRHMSLVARYQDKQAELEATLLKIEQDLDSLDDPEARLLLRAWYIQGLPAEQIGKILHYSRRTVYRRLEEYIAQIEEGII